MLMQLSVESVIELLSAPSTWLGTSAPTTRKDHIDVWYAVLASLERMSSRIIYGVCISRNLSMANKSTRTSHRVGSGDGCVRHVKPVDNASYVAPASLLAPHVLALIEHPGAAVEAVDAESVYSSGREHDTAPSDGGRTLLVSHDINVTPTQSFRAHPTTTADTALERPQTFSTPVDVTRPLNLAENSAPLDTLVYDTGATNLQTDDRFLVGFDNPNVVGDEIPLFDNASTLTGAVELADLWMVNDTNSFPWSYGFNFESFLNPFHGDSVMLGLEDLSHSVTTPQCSSGTATRDALNSIRGYFERNGAGTRPVREQLAISTPRMQIYDAELVDLLATLAIHHLAQAFPILSVQLGTVRTTKFYNLNDLSMAAVGGLFCDLPGRFRVVNAMYNDSRRILLHKAQRGGFLPLGDKLNAIRVFIILEIYGLCSGDKRSFEFVEVFHSRMLFLLKDFKINLAEKFASLPSSLVETCRALSLSLHMIECYRVILLLRPPDTFFRSLFCFSGGDAVLQNDTADRLVHSLFTPDTPISTAHTYHDKATTLLIIAISASLRLTSSDSSPIVRSLWRIEYFELALSRWHNAQLQHSTDWSLLALYHLICINLHANVGLIQRLVHASDGLRGDGRTNQLWSSLDAWRTSRHYPAAKWHAQTILSRLNEVLAPSAAIHHSSEDDGLQDGIPNTFQQAVPPESPHLPYAVYIATIVLWCGDQMCTESTNGVSTAYIDTSILLLASMRVRIAALLQRALRKLRPAMSFK
ncbi:uncharacterized protein A1O9_09173 [Exophiala aquamarina CBS 119918]|uniref:Transcription factor domain-containing protein n=1 Tax=Exophiala aquamarina CBS 119918 TaxID=1182545 RepID=A0A072P4G9_9EURO|nr:uncharacterized protein A1O9_09173 [Exophiala aquamarina CBS 119918]KEF54731.1 hypothetical protein A1O9_09173 [Exophiala aquamarina CBS 119918]